MSRYINDITLNKPDDFVYKLINEHIRTKKYEIISRGEEKVWRTKTANPFVLKFLRYEYQNGILHIEAWLKNGAKEFNLDGKSFSGLCKAYKQELDRLSDILKNTKAQREPDESFDIPDSKKKVGPMLMSILSVVLGLIGIIMGIYVPLLGIFINALGLICSKNGSAAPNKVVANIGMIISTIGIFMSVILFGLYLTWFNLPEGTIPFLNIW